MVGKTALNKEMKHLNGAYFRTNSDSERNLFFLIDYNQISASLIFCMFRLL